MMVSGYVMTGVLVTAAATIMAAGIIKAKARCSKAVLTRAIRVAPHSKEALDLAADRKASLGDKP